MSQGLQLISAVINARSHNAARRLRPELFTEEERPAYEFVSRFYRRYGTLPTPDACNENGVRLIIAPNPVDYYYDRVCNRNIGISWQEDMQHLVAGMGQANIQTCQTVLERMVRTGRSFSQQSNQVVNLHDAMELVREDYEHAIALGDGALRGITFGWDYLDQITGGATPGDVSVFVARPGMGKSWTMIYNAFMAWRAGYSVLFVTMEMTVLQTARRLFSMISGTPASDIRAGRLSAWGEQHIYECFDDALVGPPFYFVSGGLKKSVSDVEAFVLEFTPDLVIIDAAYLLDPENISGKYARYAKHEALQEVLRGLKDIALNRDIPVNISVQFNREAARGKAGLDTIGGSDWIGQVASNVFGIRPGEGAYERTRRRYEVMKVRDGESGQEFETMFMLTGHFDMSFLGEIREDGTVDNPAMQVLAQGMI